MKIKRIYSRNVIRTPRSMSLEEVAVLMRRHHVGAVLVTEDEPSENQAIGIVTDRDLVLQAMAEGIGPREATVGDVMTPSIVSVSENADIQEALEAMRVRGIRRLGVSTGEGVLVGIVSLDDIVDALGTELTSLAGVIRSERVRESAQQLGGIAEMAADPVVAGASATGSSMACSVLPRRRDTGGTRKTAIPSLNSEPPPDMSPSTFS